MTTFDLAALFLALVGLAGWVNARLLHLPTSTAMLLTGLAAALSLLLVHTLWPSLELITTLIRTVGALDFPEAVLGYMLAFLLFAGAMQVDLGELRRRVGAIASLATIGVLFSIAVVASGVWLTARVLGLDLNPAWAFVFGALICPTDPIAVLAAARQHRLSKRLQAVLQGEALFNDGVGIVVFSAAVALASRGKDLQPMAALGKVAIEAGGAALLGGVLGFAAIRLMKSIDDYGVEVGLSLALATGAYAVAQMLHLSGPITVVVAGLLLGDRGVETAMSETTERYIRGFWTLVDELLNAALFVMLGLELLVIPWEPRQIGVWAAAIILVVAARFVVVAPWAVRFRVHGDESGAAMILGWGGMRGALSLALALSLPATEARGLILSTTFAVVIFSMLVQGLTFGPLARRYARQRTDAPRLERSGASLLCHACPKGSETTRSSATARPPA